MADVLGQEGGDEDGERSVPMDKVVMLIWQFRDDPTVVTFMARFVAKVSSTFLPSLRLSFAMLFPTPWLNTYCIL